MVVNAAGPWSGQLNRLAEVGGDFTVGLRPLRQEVHHVAGTQVTRAARRLPSLRVPNKPHGVAGVYDVTDDRTPVYDRTDLDGFYVAIGTSGNQFKNAPLVARLTATLIHGVEGVRDHDRSGLTHTCEHTGQTIDLGTFSRRRRPASSTGTVL
ncbi:FAD-dependent oxidoreductase [Streptomyces niveus]